MLKYLLNTNGGNTKILKSEKGTDYKIASLSMRPDIILCPSQIIADCKKDCLVSAGRGAMSSIENIRQAKTDFFHNDKKAFLELLLKEIDKLRIIKWVYKNTNTFIMNTFGHVWSGRDWWSKFPLQLLAYMECLLEDKGGNPFPRMIVMIDRDNADIMTRTYDTKNYTRDKSIFLQIINLNNYFHDYADEWKQ